MIGGSVASVAFHGGTLPSMALLRSAPPASARKQSVRFCTSVPVSFNSHLPHRKVAHNRSFVVRVTNLDSQATENNLITTQEQLDKALAENTVVVVDWMAKWCRKCIYLKPKLQKLIEQDFPEVSLVFVDVNAVAAGVVKAAGVTKMPTLQLFRNGKKVYEIIGSHSPLEVIEEVRLRVRHTVEQG